MMTRRERATMERSYREQIKGAYRRDPRGDDVALLELRLGLLWAGLAVDLALDWREEALARARAGGIPLRDLGSLTGLSTEGARKILIRQQKREGAAR